MAKRVNFWELPVEAAQPDDTLVAYRGRGKVARIKVDDVQGSGTVTSVGLSMPAGFSVANAPVTSSGTITVTFAAGYGLPTTTQMGQWSTAFGWGDHAQAGYALASGLSAVATSGSYNDLTDKPSIPAGTVTSVGLSAPTGFSVSGSPVTGSGTLALAFASGYSLPTTAKQGQWDQAYGWGNHASAGYALASSLAAVSTSGSYNDLIGKPTLGTAASKDAPSAGNATSTQVVLGNDTRLTDARTPTSHTHTAAQVTGLAAVATTGSYNDLSDKPTLGTAAAANTGDFATAAQGAKADTALQPAAIGVTVQGYSAALNGTTASFTTALKNKLDGIAAGATANTGTVTSVQVAVPTGLQASGGPVTSSGTITISYASGYAIPTTAKQGQWDTAYGWGNHASAGYAAASHSHSAANITSGTLADARLPARIGPTAQSISDWNSATSNGWYMSSTAANAPAGGWFIGHTENHGAAGWCTQTVHAFSGDTEGDTKTYRREQNNGSWGSWYRLRVSEAEQLTQTAAYAYSKSQVDNLISAATSGAWVWQSTTTTLPKNTPSKVDFSSPRTLTLPASPAENDYVAILRTAGTTVGSTIARNGKTIMGVAEDMTLDVNVSYLRLDYVNSSWRIAS